MALLRELAALVDRLNGALGRLTGWAAALMVVIGAANAIARYLGRFVGRNLSSNVLLEAQWYLFSLVFLLGAAWALQQDAHVRVDVVYGRLSRRQQALVDIIGTVLFLVPFCIFLIVVSWPAVASSWRLLEGSPDPGGLPRYPIKTAIVLGASLLLLQGLALLVRRVDQLRGDTTPPPSPPTGTGL